MRVFHEIEGKFSLTRGNHVIVDLFNMLYILNVSSICILYPFTI